MVVRERVRVNEQVMCRRGVTMCTSSGVRGKERESGREKERKKDRETEMHTQRAVLMLMAGTYLDSPRANANARYLP